MRLTIDQLIRFQTEGYLIAEDVLKDEDLQPVIDELKEEIDIRAKALYAQGKLTELHEDEPFERRFALLYNQCPEIGRNFDIMHIQGEAMFRFLKNENLLGIIECLLGSELTCNPIQHLRAKLPWRDEPGRSTKLENVPWHQDCAVTEEDSEASEIITFWIPLVDATAKTGCMEIMPYVFKQGYLTHHVDGDTTIVPELMPQVEPIVAECRKGGVVIMNKYTPHRGMVNRSDIIRWSLDLRYHKTHAKSGRSFYPSFPVLSKSQPEIVLDSHERWKELWDQALSSKETHRWHRV